MSYRVVDTTGEDTETARVRFYSEEAAQKHAKFLNERDEPLAD